jgi:hypothetical protein
MPRGALALSSLIRGHAGWATVADYFSYNGAWRGSTHYHVSYQRFWWQELGGLDLQCRKLHIERADWDYALRPLEMMCEIRHGHIIVLPDGTLEGDKVDRYYDAELVKVFVQEDVPFPRIPEIYFRLSISGALRDIAPEITDLCEESSNENLTAERADEIKSEIKRLRRIIRIEAHKVLSKDDPAMVNLLEIIDTFNPDVELKQYQTWAKELIGAVYEAVNQIHNIRQ